jgi:hypothetical protein
VSVAPLDGGPGHHPHDERNAVSDKKNVSKSFEDEQVYGEVLFSLTNTNKHSAGKKRPEAKEQVRFQGIGTVVGRTQDGFADDKAQPQTVYKITCDFIELI